jgi:hypothetical protein
MTQIKGKQVSTKTRRIWREKKTSNKPSKAAIGYQSSTALYFKINKEASRYINVGEVKDKQQSQPKPFKARSETVLV